MKIIILQCLFIFALHFYANGQDKIIIRDNIMNNDYSYKKITHKSNGVAIKDTDADGVLVIKRNGSYYERLYDGLISVKWFGAMGDGKTDDTQSIQRAIDVISNLYPNENVTGGMWHGGATLFFPKGRYLISRTIRLKHCSSLLGESRNATNIHSINHQIAMTNIYGMKNNDVLMSNSIAIENILFTQGGIELQGAYDSHVTNCTLMNLTGKGNDNGIIIRLSVGLRISNVKVFNCSGNGILFEDRAGTGPSTTVTFDNLWVAHCNTGILIDGHTSGVHKITTTWIKNSIIEYNQTGVIMKGNISNVTFTDIHFEQNTKAHLQAYDRPSFSMQDIWADGGKIIINPSSSSEKNHISFKNVLIPILIPSHYNGKIYTEGYVNIQN